ncbi:ABC transporter permease subunit [Candidatus Latescibacterota bacterium]
MIFSIALKDFHNNFVSSRFIIGFILCLILIPLSMMVSINDYESQLRIYETDKKQAEETMKVHVWSALRPEIVKPPEPMSIFCRGVSYNVGNTVKIWFGEKPLLSTGRNSVRDNPLLNGVFSIDFCTIIAIIMSLLALVFSYDACTGEREDGTLKLIMSNAVSRSKFLLGKSLGVLVTLLPMVVFCYALSILIVLFYRNISFGFDEWLRIVLLFIMSVMLFTLFTAIGIFISSRFRSSVTSIIMCLFIWVTTVFIVPNISVYAAQSFVKVRTQENLRFALDGLDRERNNKGREINETIDTSEAWFMHFNHNTGQDGYRELKGAAKSTYEYYRDLSMIANPLRLEYADKKWPLQKAYLDELDHQRAVSEILSLFSPSEIFRITSSMLSRTDAHSHYQFLNRTRIYREELITYFKDEKLFESFANFTPLPPEDFMDKDTLVNYVTAGKFKTVDEYYEWSRDRSDIFGVFTVRHPSWDAEAPDLDLSATPQFQWKPATVTSSIKSAIGKIGVISLLSIVLFYMSFVSFTRYDVR